MKTSLAPVASLLVLSPLIAEYLLGNLTFSQMWLFPVMVLLYGGGAVLVREATRRTGRGWPTLLMLGLAYGIVEEALATQSLFNPNYLRAHLLDFGYMPALGMAAPWTVYVLVLHAVWSIAVPIALVEMLFPGRRNAPWLGAAGLGVVAAVFAAGVAATALGTWRMEHFTASGTQLGMSALAVVAVAAASFLLFQPAAPVAAGAAPPGRAPGGLPWILGPVSFLCGSEFHAMNFRQAFLSPPEMVALQFAPLAVVVAVVVTASRSPRWTAASADAVAVGALLVYVWWGFVLTLGMHGPSSLPGHCFPVGVVLALLAVVYLRPTARGAGPPGVPGDLHGKDIGP